MYRPERCPLDGNFTAPEQHAQAPFPSQPAFLSPFPAPDEEVMPSPRLLNSPLPQASFPQASFPPPQFQPLPSLQSQFEQGSFGQGAFTQGPFPQSRSQQPLFPQTHFQRVSYPPDPFQHDAFQEHELKDIGFEEDAFQTDPVQNEEALLLPGWRSDSDKTFIIFQESHNQYDCMLPRTSSKRTHNGEIKPNDGSSLDDDSGDDDEEQEGDDEDEDEDAEDEDAPHELVSEEDVDMDVENDDLNEQNLSVKEDAQMEGGNGTESEESGQFSNPRTRSERIKKRVKKQRDAGRKVRNKLGMDAIEESESDSVEDWIPKKQGTIPKAKSQEKDTMRDESTNRAAEDIDVLENEKSMEDKVEDRPKEQEELTKLIQERREKEERKLKEKVDEGYVTSGKGKVEQSQLAKTPQRKVQKKGMAKTSTRKPARRAAPSSSEED